MRPGAELKPRVSVPVWAVTLKNHCLNLEADPLLITGRVRRAQQVSHRREPSQTAHAKFCTFYLLVSGLFCPWHDLSPDPTASESYDFKTIQNIDCYNTDFCVKVRHGMRYWNMTVQWWLHHYIYPNAPFRSYTLR